VSDGNGNVLKLKVERLEAWKEELKPFIAKIETLNSFCDDHKDNIKDLPIMQRAIQDIQEFLRDEAEDKKEDRRQRKADQRSNKRIFYMVAIAIVASIVVPILLRFF
jgi:hypothetical protein